MPEAPVSCVIDTSALVAMILREPDSGVLVDAIGYFPLRILPPSCIVEFCSLRRLELDLRSWLIQFIAEFEVNILPMDDRVGWIAATAAMRYGRGSGHPAKLNFGDCMSYAFARHLEAPLLFKGDDFAHTDVIPAHTVLP